MGNAKLSLYIFAFDASLIWGSCIAVHRAKQKFESVEIGFAQPKLDTMMALMRAIDSALYSIFLDNIVLTIA